MATNADGSHYDARKGKRLPKSAARKQAEYRARLVARGLLEVRGIHAHPADHAQIRALADTVTKARPAIAPSETRQHPLPL